MFFYYLKRELFETFGFLLSDPMNKTFDKVRSALTKTCAKKLPATLVGMPGMAPCRGRSRSTHTATQSPPPLGVGDADDPAPVAHALGVLHERGAGLVLVLGDFAERLDGRHQPVQDAAALGVCPRVRRPHRRQRCHQLGTTKNCYPKVLLTALKPSAKRQRLNTFDMQINIAERKVNGTLNEHYYVGSFLENTWP